MTTFAHPAHPREITSEWLQEQIGGAVNDVAMTIIGEGRGFVGTIARLTVTGNAVPPTIIAKVTTLTESCWYHEAGPRLPGVMPAYLGGSGTMLLLGDLQGLEPGDVLQGASPRRVQAILATMERVRSAFAVRPDWLPAWDDVDIAHRESHLAEAIPRLQEYMEVPPDIVRLLALLPGRLAALKARLQENPAGVIHRDLHLDNVFFDGDRPVLTDWQSVSWGPIGIDVAHQLAEMPAVSDRRTIDASVRATYGDSLALALVWYLIGGIDWVVYGCRDGCHPRKLAVMNDMLGSGKLFAAARDWDAARAVNQLR